MGTQRIRIKRDKTFEYFGRTYEVWGTRGSEPANKGYGYEVVDRSTGLQVRDGYADLDEVRESAAADIDWWQTQHRTSIKPVTIFQVTCGCGRSWTKATQEEALETQAVHEQKRYET